jgi:hypothetical protein
MSAPELGTSEDNLLDKSDSSSESLTSFISWLSKKKYDEWEANATALLKAVQFDGKSQKQTVLALLKVEMESCRDENELFREDTFPVFVLKAYCQKLCVQVKKKKAGKKRNEFFFSS